jgi:hypothetical protein
MRHGVYVQGKVVAVHCTFGLPHRVYVIDVTDVTELHATTLKMDAAGTAEIHICSITHIRIM